VKRFRQFRWIVVLAVAAVAPALSVAWLADHGRWPWQLPAVGSPVHGDSVQAFLKQFWASPIPPQGAPPASYGPYTTSLAPRACGRCHASQYRDWRTSLHHAAMGPGIQWQFHVMNQRAANACMRCHAPLAEQKALTAAELKWPNVPHTPRPAYVPADLAHQGLVCAACHVRNQRRFGPPPRPGWPAGNTPGLPHGGFTSSTAYQDSRFCAACHQFGPGGAELNGVPLENTYREWRASHYAREGVTCQSCHMPGGRHLWRGIHDPAMVRKAVHIVLQVQRLGPDRAHASVQVTNSGAGHDFPTYLVPRVTVVLELLGVDGRVVRRLASRAISRHVNTALTHQDSDTRLPPDGQLDFGAGFAVTPGSTRHVRVRLMVDPEEWYVRMYSGMLARSDELPATALPLLRRALARARSEVFEAYHAAAAVPAPGHPPTTVAN
jgi:hypothetical protein